jgi:hypothetical protein
MPSTKLRTSNVCREPRKERVPSLLSLSLCGVPRLVLALSVVMSGVVPLQVTATIDENAYYFIVSCYSGKALDVYAESLEETANVVQWDLHNGFNQQWILVAEAEGQYSITARHSDMSLTEETDRNAAQDYYNGANQLWRFAEEADGTYTIVNHWSGRCLSVDTSVAAGLKNGSNIITSDWTGGRNQRWELIAVDGDATGENTASPLPVTAVYQPSPAWTYGGSVPAWGGGLDLTGLGAAIAYLDVGARQDLMLVAVSNPTEAFSQRQYSCRIGWDLSGAGSVSRWSDAWPVSPDPGPFNPRIHTGTYTEEEENNALNLPDKTSSGLALWDFWGDGVMDGVIASTDEFDMPGTNHSGELLLYSSIGNTRLGGYPTAEIGGWWNDETLGAGAAMDDLDMDGKPDLVLFTMGSPIGENAGVFKIGWGMNSTGVPDRWTVVGVPDQGWGTINIAGGMALADIDGNGRSEIVALVYVDMSRGHAAYLSYRIGWNVRSDGNAERWDELRSVDLPSEGDWNVKPLDCGLAIADIDSSGDLDLLVVLMSEEKTQYIIGWNLDSQGNPTWR